METFTKLVFSFDTGYSLFPNIYFGEEHIGGYNDFKFYFSERKSKKKHWMTYKNDEFNWNEKNLKLLKGSFISNLVTDIYKIDLCY